MMNTYLEMIRDRATVRKFLDKPIPDEMMEDLLEAVRMTQSWANTQCWELVLVRDSAVKVKLAGAFPRQNRAGASVLQAPVTVALMAIKDKSGLIRGENPTPLKEWFMFDTGLAAANLTNAAHQLGLGSVIAGWFDYEAAAEVLRVPGDRQLVALIPVGYPAEDGTSPPRKAIADFVVTDGYPQD